MSKTLCKGIRKDGSPCQGNALDKYDGFCIAHGPAPDQVHEWRSQGGKNSSTAARLDKRIPERLKNDLDMVEDAMQRESLIELVLVLQQRFGARAPRDTQPLRPLRQDLSWRQNTH